MTANLIPHRFDEGHRPRQSELVLTGEVRCQRCGRLLVGGAWTVPALLESEQTHIDDQHSGRRTPRQLRAERGLPDPSVNDLPSRRPRFFELR